MNPSGEIDGLIARHPDWRGAAMERLRSAILEVDSRIVEEWKYMGSPVWSLNGTLCVGNIFKDKVKLVFMYGASLEDPSGLFNAELAGNQRRAVEWHESDVIDVAALQAIIRSAIEYNEARGKK